MCRWAWKHHDNEPRDQLSIHVKLVVPYAEPVGQPSDSNSAETKLKLDSSFSNVASRHVHMPK
jgi:hypothetical protein